jgi:hypothetical protein
MDHAAPLEKWDLAANESLTVLNDNRHRHFRIYNRGPGSITVHDRQDQELANLVAGNCLDFIGDHFTIHVAGPEPAKGLCEPINLAARGRQ